MLSWPAKREEPDSGEEVMKEAVNNFVQLVGIIMIMVTLAVSTAALTQWVG